MSQSLIIEKLFGTVPFVATFKVENSCLNEGKNPIACLYLKLGTEIFTPTSMINVNIFS